MFYICSHWYPSIVPWQKFLKAALSVRHGRLLYPDVDHRFYFFGTEGHRICGAVIAKPMGYILTGKVKER